MVDPSDAKAPDAAPAVSDTSTGPETGEPAPTAACSPTDGTACRVCGTPLPLPEGAAPAAEVAGVPVALVDCPGCGARQVRTLGAPLCDGESLALRNALEYLARRRGG